MLLLTSAVAASGWGRSAGQGCPNDQYTAPTAMLRVWAEQLAGDLRNLGFRTFPSETFFFLADLAPYDASVLADRMRSRGVLVKPLDDERLGRGFLRVTTTTPPDNARFLSVLRGVL